MTSFSFVFRKSVFSTLLLLAGTSLCFSDTVTLRPVADTALYQNEPDNNLGGEFTIPVGATETNNAGGFDINRGLVKFDIAAAVPSNASISSVMLSVTVVRVPAAATPDTDSIFSLQRMLRIWGEGTNQSNIGSPSGSLAEAGQATWKARFYPNVLWSVPGAAAPVDFTNTVSATTFIRGTNTYTFNSTSILVADVQAWLNNPTANFGWILRSENEIKEFTNRRFASREDTTNAPSLLIEYSLPASTIKFSQIELAGAKVNLFFAVEANRAYAVEFRNELASGVWPTLTNVLSPVAVSNYMVSDSFSSAINRFYRIRSP